MVAMHLPGMSFISLNFLLRTASVPSVDAYEALTEHKDALFKSVGSSQAKHGIKQEAKDILYRSGAATTKSHPKPTAAELSCIDLIEKSLGISRCEAAVLLRDYLYEMKGEGVRDLLDQCPNLMDIAPIDTIEDFRVREMRNAFSCLVTVCAGASQRSTHPYYQMFIRFLLQNGDELKATVLGGAATALSGNDDKGSSLGNGTSFPGQNWWFLELLFAYCLYEPLSPVDRETLLQTYFGVVKSRRASSANLTAESGHLTSHLSGTEATALFVASINLSNGLSAILQAENDAMDTEWSDRIRELASRGGDLRAVKRVNGVLSSMREYQSTEVSMLTFSWAAFVNLRHSLVEGDGSGISEEGEVSEASEAFDALGHMSFAVGCNVFGSLRNLTQVQLQVDELIAGELYRCFWVDMVAFLTAFPPQSFNPTQVEDVVELSTSLLSRTDHGTWVDTAESIWDREETTLATRGANCLLRLASAVFPQTFRPLTSLLTALTLSQNSAERASDFLQNHLETLTEQSEGYQDALLVLDQEEDSQILESLGARNGPQFERIVRNLSAVSPDDEDVVYVQAGEDIPSDLYRPKIRKGTLGVANTSLTVVTWITVWNGFGAVDYILRFLLRLLKEHEASSIYEDLVLNELLLSSLDCLKFIDRLCRTGSKELRAVLAQDEERLSVVSSMVAELSDPGDWARGSWLTKKRREVLLTVSASCVASMTMESSSRARRALEHMSSSKNALPLQAALSALGANAFPGVAAVSRVAELCSYGESLSGSLLGKLSHLSSSREGRVASDSFHGFRGDASEVYKFLRGVALPLWLTTSVMADADAEAKSLHWLLPACSLHLFSKRPSDVLRDPAISSVIASVITAAAGSSAGYRSQTESTDTFLFPALRAALVACHGALCQRNASLQEMDNDNRQFDERREENNPSMLNDTADLTALEKVLLKPDVIHAMAVMSSGCAGGLKRRKFFSMWAGSEFRGFLPDSEPDRYLYWNVTGKDARTETICSWKEWVEDMCARCLSLHFCCLSQMSEKGDIIQVPWPTMDRTTFGYWRGGGEWIRMGYAERIANGRSVATTELLVTILSCGQRAAARSLMGPNPKKLSPGTSIGGLPGEPTKKVTLSNEDTTKPSTATASQSHTQSDNQNEKRNEILSAVVSLLCESRDEWVQLINESDELDDKDSSSVVQDLGHKSLVIAACVRFLRVGWESHSNKWFRKCWTELKVWDLLSSLLRCESGSIRNDGKVDLAKAVDSSHDFLSSGVPQSLSDMLRAFSIDNVVLKQSLSVDIVTAWKSITADCMHVFAFEISVLIGEALLMSPYVPSASEKSDQREKKVSVEVFQREPFTQFASVFTERWMHVLLKIDESYLSGCTVSGADSANSSSTMEVISITQESEEVRSIEDRTRSLSVSLGRAIGLSEQQAEQSQILNDFRRTGDVRTRFGTDYEFDVPAILSFMKAIEVNVEAHKNLILEALLLNAELNRKDVQVELVTAFSEMASAVLFADSFAPSRHVALTYSSPQFGGKLCRFLSRVLVCMIPSAARSSHTVAISAEIAKLMASLSANLSTDELQHPALTSIRFPEPPVSRQKECSMSPVAQICVSINRTLACTQTRLEQSMMDNTRLDTARWLLLTVARLAAGVSFRNAGDFEILAKCATDSLKLGRPVPNLYAAASVAICSVLEKRVDEKAVDAPIRSGFENSAIASVFAAVSALARDSADKSRKIVSCRAAASLLLAVSHIHVTRSGDNGTGQPRVLRHLSGGNVLAFLPPSNDSIPTYEASQDFRDSSHLVWCACLRLAGRTIPSEIHRWRSSADRDQALRDVLEFCTTNLLRISRDSLDLSGDWPAVARPSTEESRGHDNQRVQKYLTLGRIEEAEAACFTVFKLANYALQLQEALPELLHRTITALIQFTYQVYKVIRAEPVERSVRPVTQREKDRSQLWRNDRDDPSSHAPATQSPLPWTMSPSKTGNSTSSTPPRRSPSQALRAAIGGSGGSGRNSPGGIIPSSPGGLTPQLYSPLVGGASVQNGLHPSPGSPWGPYGSGIITDGDLYFGEEASRSLLRALSFALGALRRFADVMDVMLFKPSMVIAEEDIGLGVLVSLQYHACSEVYRGAQESRRKSLEDIVDNSLHLTMTHVLAYNERGLLTQGAKDELRKRIATVRSRMQKVAPPAPAHSLVHSQELVAFLYQLKGAP